MIGKVEGPGSFDGSAELRRGGVAGGLLLVRSAPVFHCAGRDGRGPLRSELEIIPEGMAES